MLFQSSNQQWFSLDAIEAVEDYGWDIAVFLKSGKSYRIDGTRREDFLAAIKEITL